MYTVSSYINQSNFSLFFYDFSLQPIYSSLNRYMGLVNINSYLAFYPSLTKILTIASSSFLIISSSGFLNIILNMASCRFLAKISLGNLYHVFIPS